MATKYNINPYVLLPIINIFCMLFGKFSIYSGNVRETIIENKLPILFIHSKSDDFVPSNMSIKNYESCKSNKKLLLIDCLTHGSACVFDSLFVGREIKSFVREI